MINSSANERLPLGREVCPDERKCNREAQEGIKRSAAEACPAELRGFLFSRKDAETQRPPADRQEDSIK